MKVSQLSLEETKHLIGAYQAQLNAISFQTVQINKTLTDLEKHLVRKEKQREREEVKAAKAAARAAKAAAASKAISPAPTASDEPFQKTTRGRKSTKKKKVDGRKNRKIVGGYRLGEWDTFILDTLKTENRALINSEVLAAAKSYNKAKGKAKLTEELLRRKLAAATHKLANKRGAIVKTKYSGKGFAYALPQWTRAGKLKKEFAR